MSGEWGLIITWLLERCSPGEWPWHNITGINRGIVRILQPLCSVDPFNNCLFAQISPHECNKLIPGSEQMCLE